MNLLNWVLGFLEPFRRRILLIVVLVAAELLLAALAPWPLKVLVDNVFGNVPLHPIISSLVPDSVLASTTIFLVSVVTAGVIVQLSAEFTRMAHTQMQVDMGQRVVYRLRETLLTHLQALPLRHHLNTNTADSIYRLDADAYCVDDLVIGGIFPMTVAGLNLSLMFGVLVYLDPTLAALSLSITPFLYLSLRHHAGTMTNQAEIVKALESNLISRALEVLSSIAAVKSFTRENHELRRFSAAGSLTMRARLDLTWQESLFSATVTTITLMGTALVLGVGGLHVINGQLTIGSLLVVVAYLAAVYTPISEIARTTGSLQQAIVSARRVRKILTITPESSDAPGSIDARSITGHIRFSAVGFSYGNDRTVLKNITFEANPGEVIALVGPTGAGKTTVANLIPRLFIAETGQILLDGVDISQYSLGSLRKQIALVPQHPILFTGTIADNIRYGRLNATDSDVEAASRAAHAHEFVSKLPSGYQTDVAEAGASLSGGERQRIGIARALLKDAPVLILDEPTSALDAISEAAVFDTLKQRRVGRTTLVIAHRLSTIRDATKIIVLDNGYVVAEGNHDELMASNPLYRDMCSRLTVGWTRNEIQSDRATAP